MNEFSDRYARATDRETSEDYGCALPVSDSKLSNHDFKMAREAFGGATTVTLDLTNVLIVDSSGSDGGPENISTKEIRKALLATTEYETKRDIQNSLKLDDKAAAMLFDAIDSAKEVNSAKLNTREDGAGIMAAHRAKANLKNALGLDNGQAEQLYDVLHKISKGGNSLIEERQMRDTLKEIFGIKDDKSACALLNSLKEVGQRAITLDSLNRASREVRNDF